MDGEVCETSTPIDVRSLNIPTQPSPPPPKPSRCSTFLGTGKAKRRRIALIFFSVALVCVATGLGVYYATLRKEWINIHLVPHSHDDVGWLRTPESYYEYTVKYILNNVIHELEKDPRRKFVYVETYFFWKWWIHQPESVQEAVKSLVERGQLEFAGGGWTMNDEAVVNYQSIIDQFTWGFRRLNDTFGSKGRPTVGWQIDTFGHSRETPSLFSMLGLEGVFFARIDEEERRLRKNGQSMEFIWEDREGSARMLCSVMYKHYNPPTGFHFEKEGNVGADLEEFIGIVREQAAAYKTPNIMIPMGDDFTYYNAKVWFDNMDSLIRQVESMKSSGLNVNMFYSTPSEYLKALQSSSVEWPVKNVGDLFPYGSDIFSYWTGFYTSRPSLKIFERVANNILQMSKQLLSMAGSSLTGDAALVDLREAVAILSHHDALTGTAKQEVTDHYVDMLHRALDMTWKPIFNTLSDFSRIAGKSPLLGLQPCLLLNVSQCYISENNANFVVIAYNPLSWNVSRAVRLPVSSSAFIVMNDNGAILPSQLVPIPEEVQVIPGRQSSSTMELVFQTGDIPPLGYTSFYISATSNSVPPQPRGVSPNINLGFHTYTNRLSSVTREGYTFPVEQDLMYYHGNAFWSGAYVFRPVDPYPYEFNGPALNVVVGRGPVVEEHQQRLGPWASQVVRVYDGSPVVEIEWMVGPIPASDFQGKEVIARYTSSVMSNGNFYTDTNGRGTLQRKRNKRPDWEYSAHELISGNYYPITSHISVRDPSSQMFVVIDRPQGGSSVRNGQLELMIHRRLCYDDGKGVNEALNETAFGEGLIVRGRHWLYMATGDPSAERTAKRLSLDLQNEPVLLLAPAPFDFNYWQTNFLTSLSGVASTLPQSIRILTLEPWRDGMLLLRLEHMYEKYPITYLSYPATVFLNNLFTTLEIVAARETALGADRWLSSDWLYGDIAITLNPTAIRTFLVQFKPRLFYP